MNLHRKIWISELHVVSTIRSGAYPETLKGTMHLILLHGMEMYFSDIFINVKFYITGVKKSSQFFFPNLYIFHTSCPLVLSQTVSWYLFSMNVYSRQARWQYNSKEDKCGVCACSAPFLHQIPPEIGPPLIGFLLGLPKGKVCCANARLAFHLPFHVRPHHRPLWVNSLS